MYKIISSFIRLYGWSLGGNRLVKIWYIFDIKARRYNPTDWKSNQVIYLAKKVPNGPFQSSLQFDEACYTIYKSK